MRYVLCSIDRETGSAAVLGGTTFATVAGATDAISDGRITAPLGSDVRLVDLDAATPVLVVAMNPAPVIAQSPEEAFETPEYALEAPAPEVEAEVVEDASSPAEAAAAVFAAQPGGADFEEPPVAEAMFASPEAPREPWSVSPAWTEPAPEPPAETASEPASLTWQTAPVPEPAEETAAPADDYAKPLASEEVEIATWSFAAEDGAAVGPSLTRPDLQADDIARSELWWAEVGAEDLAAAEVAPPVEPTRAVTFEDAALVAEIGALAGEQALEEAPAEEAVAPQEPLPDIAESPSVFDAGDRPAEAADLWASAAGQETVEDQPEVRFAPIDFDAWSCTDCVFTATCPRNGTDRPATCGSFQWRAE